MHDIELGDRHFATQTQLVGGPTRYLVCVPAKFLSIPSDPLPSQFECQFVNSSCRWVINVAEVSSRGLLISKAHLLPGDRWNGHISNGSVFLVTVIPKQSPTGLGAVKEANSHGSWNLLVRQASILDRHHKLSILWIPAVSLSVSHSSAWQTSRRSGNMNIEGKVNSQFRCQVLDAPSSIESTLSSAKSLP